jgi:hypothetical protein
MPPEGNQNNQRLASPRFAIPVRQTGQGRAPKLRFGKVQTGVDTPGANV